MVKIGDIWQNGQCAYTPSYQTETFKKLDITKDTTAFIKAGLSLDGEFLLPLNEHPWHRWHTQSYCLSTMLLGEKRIIIPCVELIRFYFGSSSKLLHILFTKLISAELLWKSKHFDDSSGRLHLKLASGLSGMSATDIGRIALDKNAWHAARLIFHTCMSASVQREPIYPYTGFPFTGETDLVASGKWLSNGATPERTFVVYSLKSCSHPFPYTSLSYEVADNKTVCAKSRLRPQGKESQGAATIGKATTTKSQTLADTDPGTSRSSKEHWFTGNPRFPDLTKKLVWRERYDTMDPPAVIFLKSGAQDEQVSVGECSSSNGEIRNIDIAQGPSYITPAEIDLKRYKFVYDGIKVATQQAKLQAGTTTAGLITLPGYTHPVISLPHLVDENGEIDSVSFCSDGHGGQRLRRGCFVELKEGEKTCYMVFVVEKVSGDLSVKAIKILDFDLKHAMEKLIEES